MRPVCIVGEAQYHGNRLIDFDLVNDKLTLKLSRKDHQLIELEQPHKKVQAELNRVQELAENKLMPVTVMLTSEYVWLTYDESLLKIHQLCNLKANRVLGIDLNPNALGISILEFEEQDNFKVLHKEVIDTFKLNQDKVSTNKRKFELIQICYHVKNLVDCWKCGKVAIEELNIKPGDKGKGRWFNKMCNNRWDRSLVANKLKMLGNE